jgi:hypothetical protein
MGIGELVYKILDEILNNHFNTENAVLSLTKGIHMKLLCATKLKGVTFASNYLTGNQQNQKEIWELLYPAFFQNCFKASTGHEVLQTRLCMMLYNCSCNNPMFTYDFSFLQYYLCSDSSVKPSAALIVVYWPLFSISLLLIQPMMICSNGPSW